jgi:hypothetical protein
MGEPTMIPTAREGAQRAYWPAGAGAFDSRCLTILG